MTKNKSLIAILRYETARAAEQIAKKRLADAKADFYGKMDELYDTGNFDGKNYNASDDGVDYSVTRVIRRKVDYDINEMKKKLPSDVISEVIEKQVSVIDYKALAKYVKSLGGNAAKLKSMLHVDESVNEKKLDELSELGEFDESLMEGCFSISESEPTYQLRVKK